MREAGKEMKGVRGEREEEGEVVEEEEEEGGKGRGGS